MDICSNSTADSSMREGIRVDISRVSKADMEDSNKDIKVVSSKVGIMAMRNWSN